MNLQMLNFLRAQPWRVQVSPIYNVRLRFFNPPPTSAYMDYDRDLKFDVVSP